MIKQVASIVGPGHQVDLKNYELLIIVEVYQVSLHAASAIQCQLMLNLQNICGVSVVDTAFDELKRFNLAEIYDPTPREVHQEVKETLEQAHADAAGDSAAPTQPASAPVVMDTT